jgi:transcriptional regulator with GAF, ATPase, and Fis domain
MSRGDDATRSGLLYELACSFAARIDLGDLVPLVVQKCRDALEADGASVMLLDRQSQELYFHTAAEDPEVVATLRELRFPADQGIAGHVLQTGQAVRVDDVAGDPRFYRGVDEETHVTTRNMVCAPLRVGDEVVGVVQVVNRHGEGPFSDADLALLVDMAGSIAVAIENARTFGAVKASEERLRVQVVALRRDRARHDSFTEIVGDSAAMREVFQLMETAAASPIAVLIEGETGTGKELVARGIHRASDRADGPFVAVNCAAIPETMLERELFGHRRGAFTGATHDQRGLFEAADGGTILLDEIGEMPVAMQPKLLRVLQEGDIVPLGDSRPRRVDVRVLSATNRDLLEEVEEKVFREDLFYRLAAFPITLPPLRERPEDVALLVRHVLAGAAERHKKRIAGIDPETLELLERYRWPGNVRELQNELERAVALVPDAGTIGVRHLSRRVTGTARATPPPVGPARPADDAPVTPLREARSAFEAAYIADVLRREGGNVSRAARTLGLSRVMLQRKMKAYDLR